MQTVARYCVVTTLASIFSVVGAACATESDPADDVSARAFDAGNRVAAAPLARTDDLNFGIAGDSQFVFITSVAMTVDLLDSPLQAAGHCTAAGLRFDGVKLRLRAP